MTLLQIYFHRVRDKSVVGKWGRSEMKTPTMNQMLGVIAADPLFQVGDNKIGISNDLLRIYDELGAYIHTRGVPTINMGLVGSNMLTFSSDAFDRFMALFSSACHHCIVLVAAFFPAAIIQVPAFAKSGYFDPIWLPRKEKVECIRSALSQAELRVLEDLATQNSWFQGVLAKTRSLPDLTPSEIDETYQRFTTLAEGGIEEVSEAVQKVNELFE